MRNQLISRLNRALDTDHNTIEQMLVNPKHIIDGDMFTDKITALHMLCDLLEVERIYPVYENDIIQRFE